MNLNELTATELLNLMGKGEVSSREITESVLNCIQQREETIHAYITLTEDLALKLADEADRRRKKGEVLPPLNGIPIAIKDLICTQGIPTTCGSKMLKDYIPPYNATVVDRVLTSGAVLMGKTNMDEFGMGSSNENSAFGPSRNPNQPEYVTGGSSGGAAAAVAAGETILSLGSDTGGSIRLPSAYCGVTGIKPTYGRVSRYGLIAYASSLDQIGPIARGVEDCALLLNIICGHDKKDSTSTQDQSQDFTRSINKGVNKVVIGLPKEYFIEGLNIDVRNQIIRAVKALEESGAEIREISLPHTRFAVATYYLLATAEASSNLSRFDGVRFGFRACKKKSDLFNMVQETKGYGFGQEVKRRIMLGTFVLSAGYYENYYLKAQKARTLIKSDFDSAFEKVDCIITPVSPCLPFKLGEKISEPLQMYLVDIYTVSANLAGLPAMSINCGWHNGLPIGIQIIGRAFDEKMLIQVGRALEIQKEVMDNGI